MKLDSFETRFFGEKQNIEVKEGQLRCVVWRRSKVALNRRVLRCYLRTEFDAERHHLLGGQRDNKLFNGEASFAGALLGE